MLTAKPYIQPLYSCCSVDFVSGFYKQSKENMDEIEKLTRLNKHTIIAVLRLPDQAESFTMLKDRGWEVVKEFTGSYGKHLVLLILTRDQQEKLHKEKEKAKSKNSQGS